MQTYLTMASSPADPVVRGPHVRSKSPGEWAEFECKVACSHSIDWYVEGYNGYITESCSSTRNGLRACRQVTQPCSSTTSTADYVETLRVLAESELASSSIAVQCAAVSLSLPIGKQCTPFLSYSRYSLLAGRHVWI